MQIIINIQINLKLYHQPFAVVVFMLKKHDGFLNGISFYRIFKLDFVDLNINIDMAWQPIPFHAPTFRNLLRNKFY